MATDELAYPERPSGDILFSRDSGVLMNFLFYVIMTLFIVVCLFLILLVLIQKGRGGGLASAFGGAGGNTAFGSKTGDVLTWTTSVVFGIFLLLAISLNLLSNYRQRQATAASQIITAPTQSK
jgi:protein translocase SecG subunit